jgi:hypothetical protein
MRRFSIGFLSLCVTTLLGSAVLVGCGGPKEDDDDAAPPKKKQVKVTRTTETLKPVSAIKYSTLKGKVTYEGDANFQDLTDSLHKTIAGSPDRAYCMSGGPNETNQQNYRVGANKGLGNVFVWIQPERGSYFVVPKDQLDAVQKEVALHQPHCAFLPHALVLFPSYYGADGKQVPTGQKFFILNDATVAHNAKVTGSARNSLGSMSIPPRAADGTPTRQLRELVPDRQEVKVACDVHGWMNAYIRVFDHPYAAVTSVGGDPAAKKWEDLTSPKVGEWEIKGVPVGAKVKLFAWHETLGWLGEGGQTGKDLTIKETNEDIPFSAKGK